MHKWKVIPNHQDSIARLNNSKTNFGSNDMYCYQINHKSDKSWTTSAVVCTPEQCRNPRHLQQRGSRLAAEVHLCNMIGHCTLPSGAE